jgi:hypothetical protein
MKAKPRRSKTVTRESGQASDNRRWLERLVRLRYWKQGGNEPILDQQKTQQIQAI